MDPKAIEYKRLREVAFNTKNGKSRIDYEQKVAGLEEKVLKENMPSSLIPVILDLKSEHSNIFYYQVSGMDFIFRLAKRYEFDTYTLYKEQNGDSDKLKRTIFERCVLYRSEEPDDMKAFTEDSLIETIYQMSDFENVDYYDDLQFAFENSINDGVLRTSVPWIIQTHNQNLKPKDLLGMDILQQSEYLGALCHFSGGETQIIMSQKNANKVQSRKSNKDPR